MQDILADTRPVQNFPEYRVSSFGVVIGPKGPLKNNTGSRGYSQVSLACGPVGQRRAVSKLVHRLVAEAFIANPSSLPEVNHKDGNKSNNAVCNLEWVSSSDNKLHGTSLGLYPTQSRHYRWTGGSPRNEARLIRREEIRTKYNQGVTDYGS